MTTVEALTKRYGAFTAVDDVSLPMVERIGSLIDTKGFRPVIGKLYPIDQIVEAYRYLEAGSKVGNVVITIPPPSDQAT